MKKFDVLSRDLTVWGSHFLEASAGTGKTFAIEHFVVRLLLSPFNLKRAAEEGEVMQDFDSKNCIHLPSQATLDRVNDPLKYLNIEQILVVTFTKAATRELKLRIHNNLSRALQQLKCKEGSWDYLSAIIEQGDPFLKEAICCLENALACFDLASIFTIHGFCHRALNEFAFEAGILYEINDPDNGAYLKLFNQVIDDVLKEQTKLPFYSTTQISIILNRFKKNIDKLKSQLLSKVLEDKDIEYSHSFIEDWQRWNVAIALLPKINKEQFLADYKGVSSIYKEMNPYLDQVDLVATILEKREASIEEFDRLLEDKLFFIEKMIPSNVKKRVKNDPPMNTEVFDQIRTQLGPILQSAKDPKRILLRLAKECQMACQEALKGRDLFFPDTLLKQMQKSIGNPRFVKKLQDRYLAVIIDEFQDTDPMQWDIFNSLFVSHPNSSSCLGMSHTVCLVGDPKQSIYAFRNADIYTYLQAADHIGGVHCKFLDTNFRSTPALVDALNRLFASEKTKEWVSVPQSGLFLQAHPVQAGLMETPSIGEKRGSIHFFATCTHKDRKKDRWPSKGVENHRLFPFIAQEMIESKGDGPWSQFAILIKDRYQAQRLYDFLYSVNIPAVISKVESLSDSHAAIAMIELMEAICLPFQIGNLKKLLAGPLIGWSLDQIQGDFEQVRLRQAKQQIIVLQDCLIQKGFALFFQAFLQSSWSAPYTVEERILSLHQLNLYSDLVQLAEIVVERTWNKQIILRQYLLLLHELNCPVDDEDQSLKKRGKNHENAVHILTTHASKGLEFDIVFALGMASRAPSNDAIVIQEMGAEKIVPLDLVDNRCRKRLFELDAEKMRQFYVALTRAKTRAYVPLIFDEKQEEVSLGEASPVDLFFEKILGSTITLEGVKTFLSDLGGAMTFSTINGDIDSVHLPSASVAMESIDPLSPPLPIPSFPKEQVFSYSMLAKQHASPSYEVKPSDMPLGVETGLLFHQIMEKLFNQGLHYSPDKAKIALLIESQIATTNLSSWGEVLLLLIWNLLHLPLQTGSSSCVDIYIKDLLPAHVKQEMEFLFPVDKGLMKGFIDLVFEKEGKYYILDWKTNFLGSSAEDYTNDRIYQSMQQHDYFLQASIYAQCLKRYVKLFDKRAFSECFGGSFYIYVRGLAVYFVPPDIHKPIEESIFGSVGFSSTFLSDSQGMSTNTTA